MVAFAGVSVHVQAFDFYINCKTKTYDVMFVYSLLMLALFTCGVPIFYATILYRKRHLIFPHNAGRVMEVLEANDSVTIVVHDHNVPGNDRHKLEGRLLSVALELKRMEAEVRGEWLLTALTKLTRTAT